MLANGGTVILISDGEENKGPWIAEELPKLLAKGVIVHTFALGPSAEAKLHDVTLQTGGTAYFFPDYQKNIIASMGISFILSTSAHLEDSQKPVFVSFSAGSFGLVDSYHAILLLAVTRVAVVISSKIPGRN